MKVDKSLLSGSTTLLVLSLLKTGDMYGYEMIAELSRRSDKTFELKEGTLYPFSTGWNRRNASAPTRRRPPQAGYGSITTSLRRA